MKGGGYYLDVRQPSIGGKLPISTYSKQCPPIFCGDLMKGGGEKSYIHNINLLNFMSNKLTKQKLYKIINLTTLNKLEFNKNIKNVNFYKYFNKPTMRVISSISIMNLLNNGKLNNHKDRIDKISKIMNTNSSNILQVGGSNIYFKSFNSLLTKLFSYTGLNQTGGGERIEQLKQIKTKILEFIRPLQNIMIEKYNNFKQLDFNK